MLIIPGLSLHSFNRMGETPSRQASYLAHMIDYLQGLNDRQKEATLHIDGPLMIVAGAGSGKTKVLTTRVAHLMANGVDAFNILALTFTNKAQRNERTGGEDPWE